MAMGYYSFVIRFLKVKDISRVDPRRIAVDIDNPHCSGLEDYLVRAKDNCAYKLKTLTFIPSKTSAYDVRLIKVPEETEVIAFSNSASTPRDFLPYQIRFNYQNMCDDYSIGVYVPSGNNRFMLVPEVKNSSKLVSIDYEIGYPHHSYNEDQYGVIDLHSRTPSRVEKRAYQPDQDDMELSETVECQPKKCCLSLNS